MAKTYKRRNYNRYGQYTSTSVTTQYSNGKRVTVTDRENNEIDFLAFFLMATVIVTWFVTGEFWIALIVLFTPIVPIAAYMEFGDRYKLKRLYRKTNIMIGNFIYNFICLSVLAFVVFLGYLSWIN
jgi:hypothetical protein